MKRYRRLRNAGFSLVEIIVALAIMSLVTLAIGSFLTVSQRSYTNGATETDLQYESQLLANTLQDLVIDVNRGITYTYSAKLADDSEELGDKIHTDTDIYAHIPADELQNYKEYTKSLYVYNKGGYIVITWDQATGEMKYSTYEPKKEVVPVSENNLLAEYVTGFSVDLSEIREGGSYTVSYTITFEKSGKTYTTTHKIKLRNEVSLDVTADIYDDPSVDEVRVGDIVVAPSEIILWPGEDYGTEDGKTISATVSSTGGLLMFKNAEWKIYFTKPEGSTLEDSDSTPAGSKVEKRDGKVVVTVADDETLNDFYVYAEVTDGDKTVSSLYNDDGVATTFTKCLHVYVRRINSMTGDVTAEDVTYSADTVALKEGTTGVATHLTAFTVTPNPSSGDYHIDTEINATYSNAASVITAVGGLASITVTETYYNASGVLVTQDVTGANGQVVQSLSVDPNTGIVSFNLKEMEYDNASYYDNTRVVIKYLTNRMNTSVNDGSAYKKTITVTKKATEILNPSNGWDRDGLLPLDMDTLNSIMSAERAKGLYNPEMRFEFYSGHATAYDSDGNVTAMQRTPDTNGYPRVYNTTIGNNGGFDNVNSTNRVTLNGREYIRYNNNGGDVYVLAQVTNNQVKYDSKYYDIQLYLDNSDVFPYSGLFVGQYGYANNNDCLEVHITIQGANGGYAFDKTYFIKVNPVAIQYSIDGLNWSDNLDVSLLRGTADSTKRVYFRFTEGWGGALINAPAFVNKTYWYGAYGDDDFNTTELGYTRTNSRFYLGKGYAGSRNNREIYSYVDNIAADVDGLINRFNVSMVNPNTGKRSSYYYVSDGYTNKKLYKSGSSYKEDGDITLPSGAREHNSYNDYFKYTDYGEDAYFSEYTFSQKYGRAANYFSVTQGSTEIGGSKVGYLDFVVDKDFVENNKGKTLTVIYEENPYLGHPNDTSWESMAGCSGQLNFVIRDDNVRPENLITNLETYTVTAKTPSILCVPEPSSTEWTADSSKPGVSYYQIADDEKYELIYKDGKHCLTYLKRVNNAWVNQWSYESINSSAHTKTTRTGYLQYSTGNGEYGLEYIYVDGTSVPYYSDNVIYQNIKYYLDEEAKPSSLYAPEPGSTEWITSKTNEWYYTISSNERYYLEKYYDQYDGVYYYDLTYTQKGSNNKWNYKWKYTHGFGIFRDTDVVYLRYSSSNKTYSVFTF